MVKGSIFIVVCCSFLFGSIGCSSPEQSPTAQQPVSPIYADGPSEAAFCTTTTDYGASFYTITGSATFEARQPTSLASNPAGLGAAGAPKPVRWAEIIVTDSSGSIAQCASTDGSGNFSLKLPQSGQTYTLSVNSRGQNSSVNASVLDQPENKAFYSITTSVVSDGDKSVGTLNAGVTGSVIGAAFNIFDQIVTANDFLRTEAGTCSFTGCQSFTVAPHVEAYWRKGFNPNDYFGSGLGGVSFYLPGYSRLFILGGVNGDVDNSDTDHFDNSVILHEYGHFIEDLYTKTDSPGGPHTGNGVIDPRLAWGEGWGNFFQAAVLNNPKYIDTVGNIDGSTSFAIYVDTEEASASCGGASPPPICDVPEFVGEGNFREFEITRFLWDIYDTNDEGGAKAETISGGFDEVWAALTTGFRSPTVGYRSIGLLHQLQSGLSGGTDWDPLRSLDNHRHGTDAGAPIGYRRDWATYVATGTNCSLGSGNELSITPNGAKSSNHLLVNNDFYYFNHAGGALSLTLKYQTQSGQEADLDLYIYSENSGRIWGDSSVDVTYKSENQEGSSTTEPDSNIGTAETDPISLSLAAGKYLIKVQAYVASVPGGPTNYELELGGVDLCPATQP